MDTMKMKIVSVALLVVFGLNCAVPPVFAGENKIQPAPVKPGPSYTPSQSNTANQQAANAVAQANALVNNGNLVQNSNTSPRQPVLVDGNRVVFYDAATGRTYTVTNESGDGVTVRIEDPASNTDTTYVINAASVTITNNKTFQSQTFGYNTAGTGFQDGLKDAVNAMAEARKILYNPANAGKIQKGDIARNNLNAACDKAMKSLLYPMNKHFQFEWATYAFYLSDQRGNEVSTRIKTYSDGSYAPIIQIVNNILGQQPNPCSYRACSDYEKRQNSSFIIEINLYTGAISGYGRVDNVNIWSDMQSMLRPIVADQYATVMMAAQEALGRVGTAAAKSYLPSKPGRINAAYESIKAATTRAKNFLTILQAMNPKSAKVFYRLRDVFPTNVKSPYPWGPIV